MLDGDLLTNQVEQVLLDLGAQRATGCLTVLDAASEEAEVYLKEGLVYSVDVPGRRPRLGAALVSLGALAPEARDEALEIQRRELQGWRLGELLIHLGFSDRAAVESVVSEQLVDMLSDLLGWDVDTWRFRKNKKARQDVAPPTEVPDVLTQVHERRTRWEDLRRDIGGPDAVPVLSAREPTTEDVVLGPGEWAVLCMVDGTRTLADLAFDCGFTLFQGAEVVAALVRAGLVDLELDELSLADSPESAPSSGGGWDDLPEPSPEELAASVAQVTAALAKMFDEQPATELPDEAAVIADTVAPAGWQDHLAWVEDQRRIAEYEGQAARAEAERLAEAMRVEREQRTNDKARRRKEADEVARTVEEARQAELARIEGERAKERDKLSRKERKAAEAAAWLEHEAWLAAERAAVEDSAWADHAVWVTAQYAAAEIEAWDDHAVWLEALREEAAEEAWADHANWLADELARAEEAAWLEHAQHLAVERAEAEGPAWEDHAAWLRVERESVEEEAWEAHLTWVESQLAVEAARLEAEWIVEEERLEAERLAEEARLAAEAEEARLAAEAEEARLAEEAEAERLADELQEAERAALLAETQAAADAEAALEPDDGDVPDLLEGLETYEAPPEELAALVAPRSIEPKDAPSSTELVMPLVSADEAEPSSWESYETSPAAVLSALSRELPAQREGATDDASIADFSDPEDDRPTPVFDRSMTDTAALLRELSGLFQADDPEPPKPTPSASRQAPPPPQKKKKGLFGRGG